MYVVKTIETRPTGKKRTETKYDLFIYMYKKPAESFLNTLYTMYCDEIFRNETSTLQCMNTTKNESSFIIEYKGVKICAEIVHKLLIRN